MMGDERLERRFVVVDATPQPCSYLPGREATLPLKRAVRPLSPADFDALLAQGERRMGGYFYRTACVGCRACEMLRVPVDRFRMSRSQGRTARRNRDVRVELGPIVVDAERLELYNRHKSERGLDTCGRRITADEYWSFLGNSHVRSVEVRYFVDDRLIALSILDLGAKSASSVYHYFDPTESKRSLGVFSVLAEIVLCQQLELDWYYLGYWVRECRHLSYKSQYLPHERLIGERWVAYETD